MIKTMMTAVATVTRTTMSTTILLQRKVVKREAMMARATGREVAKGARGRTPTMTGCIMMTQWGRGLQTIIHGRTDGHECENNRKGKSQEREAITQLALYCAFLVWFYLRHAELPGSKMPINEKETTVW